MSGDESELEEPTDETEEGAAPNNEVEEETAEEKAEKELDKVKPTIYIGLVLTGLFLMGAVDMLTNVEDNGCAMTYMYEYPKYIRVNMDEETEKRFPKYGLYAYGEGEGDLVEKIKKEKYIGIPVLFIPGNSGSYKQVRSLASVALRQALKDTKYDVHFDYFAVDFSEEFSALYGAVLEEQAEFVKVVISRILRLYSGGDDPGHVMLVGHSVGGLIAKRMLTESETVDVVLTLATPHTPVLQLDSHTFNFYSSLNNRWSEGRLEGGNLTSKTLVSIGGGHRDTQVRGGLTEDLSADVNILTTAVPSVWVSTDHRCIVWCKQLVLAINRAMFDMVDPVTKQISSNPTLRKDILHYHLVHRSGGKKYKPSSVRHPEVMEMDANGFWTDMVKKQFIFDKKNTTCDQYVMVKIDNSDPSNRFLTLDAIKMDNDNWVYGCKSTKVYKNTRVCEEGENLSGLSTILPSRGKRKAIHLNLMRLAQDRGFTHIVVRTPAKTEDTRVHMDMYNPRERRISYMVPKWINFWRMFPVIQSTLTGAVFYNISLTGIDQPWQAYTVHVTPLQCQPSKDDKHQLGLARFVTPWAADVTQVILGGLGDSNFTNKISAKLQAARPTGSNDTLETPQVHLYLNPSCTYSVTIGASMPQMMGQMMRFYAPLLIPCVVGVLVLIITFQMRRIESHRFCQSPLLTLMACVSPMNVVLPSRLLSYVVTLVPAYFMLPPTDITLLQTAGLDFGILPIMLFFGSMGIVFLLVGLVWIIIIGFGTMIQKGLTRLLTSGISPIQGVLGELAVSSMARFPSILSVLLISLAISTCGSLSLCLGSLAYLLKLISMYQEYLDTVVKRSLGLREEDDLSLLQGLHHQLPLAVLWLTGSILQLPVLLTWGSSLSGSLPADPSLPHAIVMSLSLASLWQNDGKPRVEKKYFSVMAIILNMIAIFIISFSFVSLYRLSYAISGVFVIVGCHQLLAPNMEQPNEVGETEGDDADNGNNESDN